MFESGFHLLPLGGVEHQRDLDVRNESRGELMHVSHAVSTYEINVEVENVCAFAFLFLAERDETVPVFGVKQVTHLLRAAGVHSLADDQKRCVLTIRLLEVDR